MTIEEFKELVKWAKTQNIAQIQVDGFCVTFFSPTFDTLNDEQNPISEELRRQEEERLALFSAGE